MLDQNQAETLLRHGMGEILDIEEVQVELLGTIVSVAGEEIRPIFSQHQEVTRNQLERLRSAFGSSNGSTIQPVTCNAIRGFRDDFQMFHGSNPPGPALDSFVLVAAQKIEQIEILCYESMSMLANQVERTDLAGLFDSIREEETQALAQIRDVWQRSLVSA